MSLYLINPNIEISNKFAKYLLQLHTEYNGQVCDIIEVTNPNTYTFSKGYLDKLTIGKLHRQTYNVKIWYYISDNCDDILYYLMQSKQVKYNDIIYCLGKYNAPDCLKVALFQGIDVNTRGNFIETFLHTACRNNYLECVEILLNNGADITIRNNFDSTCVRKACFTNNFRCVKLLYQHAIKLNLQEFVLSELKTYNIGIYHQIINNNY